MNTHKIKSFFTTSFLSRTQQSTTTIETSPTQCLVSDQGWHRSQGVSPQRRQCLLPVWSPIRHPLLLSGIASSIQPPSTLERTPSASWRKTTRSASTSSLAGGGCRIWRFSSSDIFVIFHSMDDRDSPSEPLRVFLYILHI